MGECPTWFGPKDGGYMWLYTVVRGNLWDDDKPRREGPKGPIEPVEVDTSIVALDHQICCLIIIFSSNLLVYPVDTSHISKCHGRNMLIFDLIWTHIHAWDSDWFFFLPFYGCLSIPIVGCIAIPHESRMFWPSGDRGAFGSCHDALPRSFYLSNLL